MRPALRSVVSCARLDGLVGGLQRLRALDEVGDLLATLAPDALEVTRAVLLGDRFAALTPDPAEELGTVFLRCAGAALLADLLVELGAVALAHEAPAHSAGFGNGHRAAFLLWHRMLLFSYPRPRGDGHVFTHRKPG